MLVLAFLGSMCLLHSPGPSRSRRQWKVYPDTNTPCSIPSFFQKKKLFLHVDSGLSRSICSLHSPGPSRSRRQTRHSSSSHRFDYTKHLYPIAELHKEGLPKSICNTSEHLIGITNLLGMVVRSSNVVRHLSPSRDCFASRWMMGSRTAQTSSSFHLWDASVLLIVYFLFRPATRRSRPPYERNVKKLPTMKDSWHEESLRTDREVDIYRTLDWIKKLSSRSYCLQSQNCLPSYSSGYCCSWFIDVCLVRSPTVLYCFCQPPNKCTTSVYYTVTSALAI